MAKGILDALARYRGGARAAAWPEKKTAPALETLRLLREGHTFEDIAKSPRTTTCNRGEHRSHPG